MYEHTKSNHPPTVLKEVPKSINKRFSKISSTERKFNAANYEYQKALNESGHKYKLAYEKPEEPKEKTKKSKRDIIWYNPPFNLAVRTNVGRKFLSPIDKHFPKSNKLSKLLNRNTVKISYSYTKTIKAIIQSHNAKIINSEKSDNKSEKMQL